MTTDNGKNPDESELVTQLVTPHPDVSQMAIIAGTRAVMNFITIVPEPSLGDITAVCLSAALPEIKKTLGVK